MKKPKKAKKAKKAAKKSKPKGKSTKAKAKGMQAMEVTCRLWCPQCKKYINGTMSPDECRDEAKAHNIDHPGHHAGCECEQRG